MTSGCATSRINVAICAILLVTLFAGQAFGDDKELAKAKFLDGMAHVEEENYPAALEAFEESYRIRPKASVLFNIGMCFKALFRYTESIASFERYLEQEEATAGKSARRAQAEDALAQMEQLVGRLRIEGAPPGAMVEINGKQVGTTPLAEPLRLDPGKHAVEVSKEGHEGLDTEVTIASGAVTNLRASLEVLDDEVEGKEPQPSPDPVERRDPRKVGLLASGIAAGVVGIGIAGGVGGYFTYQGGQDFEDGKEAARVGDQETYDDVANNRLPRDRAGMIAGYAIGGALVVTGIVLVYFGLKEESPETDPVAFHPGAGGLRVTF